MGTYFRTYLRIESNVASADAVTRAISVLRSAPEEECRFARVQFRDGFPWLRIEHLGFYSLRQTGRTETVIALVRELPIEAVVLAAQTTASCAAYGHYIGGTLCRFLSAGDGQWFELYGAPEPWERDLFSKEFPWEYKVGGDSPLHDGTLSRVAAYYDLPRNNGVTSPHMTLAA